MKPLEFIALPPELVAQLDDPARYLREPSFSWAHETTARAAGGELLPQLLDQMVAHIGGPLRVTARADQLGKGQHNGLLHWHTDYTAGYRMPRQAVRVALYVAGRPRTLFQVDGETVLLPEGHLAVFDGGVRHRGARASAPGPRWLVRGLWLAEGHPMLARQDSPYAGVGR